MTRRTVKALSYAKVNLALNIEGPEGGMHALDTVMASVDLADAVSVCERFDSKINIEYSDKSIVLGTDSGSKAAEFFKKRFGDFGADIFIEKNIPIAAGLGGSSVDAAGVIKALSILYGFNVGYGELTPLGSDTPFVFKGGLSRLKGTGADLEFFSVSSPLYMVIVIGEGGVSTREAYIKFDEMYKDKRYCPADTGKLIAALKSGDRIAAYECMDNALTAPAMALNRDIEKSLALLASRGAEKVIMTGSGSACAGFYNSFPAAAAAEKELYGKSRFVKAVKMVPDL
jgi:4-diphosphocytidyl-2-C-methyl-D-erythritol kinase